jgi:hypothetical protein
MSDMDQKRDFVMALYKGAGWKKKVQKMPDNQVIAIYMRETNKAKERPKPPKPKESTDETPF